MANVLRSNFFKSNLQRCSKFVTVARLQRIVVNKMVDDTKKTLGALKAKLKTVVNLNTLTPGKFQGEVDKSTAEYISGVVLSNFVMTRE